MKIEQYGHVMRRDDSKEMRVVMDMIVNNKRRKGKPEKRLIDINIVRTR